MSYFPVDRARGIDLNLKILKKTKQLNHFARENSNKRKVQAPNLSAAKIVYLPNSNQITYHFHNKSSRVSVDAPWSELSVSNTNTDTPSLSPFCLQINDGENSITVGLELVKHRDVTVYKNSQGIMGLGGKKCFVYARGES